MDDFKTQSAKNKWFVFIVHSLAFIVYNVG